MKYRVIIRKNGNVHVTEMEGRGYADVCKQVHQMFGRSAVVVNVELVARG